MSPPLADLHCIACACSHLRLILFITQSCVTCSLSAQLAQEHIQFFLKDVFYDVIGLSTACSRDREQNPHNILRGTDAQVFDYEVCPACFAAEELHPLKGFVKPVPYFNCVKPVT